ncbi:MAG: YlxR family protein [Candidatus Rokuibacteriota bacterium]
MMHEPTRTCLGCRGRKPKRAMVRLVRGAGGTVVVDAGGGSGRGAYVCAEAACLERALRGGRLAHAFRKQCEAGPGLAEEVRGLWQQRK